MPEKLPSQREFLTNLLHALCDTDDDDDSSGTANAATRATERHPSPAADTWGSLRRRKLVLTLHVVFPGMLLPALDLLDRQLLRRLTVSAATATATGQVRDQEDEPSSSPSDAERKEGGASETARHAVYTVRSLASTLPRRGAGVGAPAAARRDDACTWCIWPRGAARVQLLRWTRTLSGGIQGHAEAASSGGGGW
ncbi:hypothetical protein NLG97_g1004 [Lecanicillium saksenae]|uniref:Uncharacterized protein n=1 Tax=Lecanicillium saksenae TaxID=468837 RepID=A0ACC1R5M0_9HYPO|nr:hypothetical protein NLG97_g1004 [Lecanicillium saksenae]